MTRLSADGLGRDAPRCRDEGLLKWRGLLHLLNLQNWVLAGTGVLALSVLFWLPLVRGITRDAAAQNYRFSSIVLGIVKSAPFQMKKAQTDATIASH